MQVIWVSPSSLPEIKDQRPKTEIKDQRSETRDQRPEIKDQSSKTRDLISKRETRLDEGRATRTEAILRSAFVLQSLYAEQVKSQNA